MEFVSPVTPVLIAVMMLLYGTLIGGTWVKRRSDDLWDTIATMIFITVAGIATVHLIYIGVKQSGYNREAQDRLNCVAEQIEALRSSAPAPACDVRWHR